MKKPRTAYGNMLRELAITDFKLKYQGSVLGYVWSFAKPLMLFAVMFVVFTKIIKLGGNIPHYPLYLLLGIVLWIYFADSTTAAMVSIVERRDLIRKVYFPRLVIVAASSISNLITLTLNMLVIVGFMLLAHIDLGMRAFLFIPVLIELYLVSLGCALFLSALYVRYRDFRHIWEVTLQIVFYASPIIYPLTLIPQRFVHLAVLSPIAQIMQDARWALITPKATTAANLLHFPWVLIPYLIPIIFVAAAKAYFDNQATRFAEEI